MVWSCSCFRVFKYLYVKIGYPKRLSLICENLPAAAFAEGEERIDACEDIRAEAEALVEYNCVDDEACDGFCFAGGLDRRLPCQVVGGLLHLCS